MGSTLFTDIAKNEISEADFSTDSFYEESANNLIEVLKNNTSIIKINFSLSNLVDYELAPILKTLKERPTILEELNLDSTDITYKSDVSIREFITSGKVKSLLMFHLKGYDLKKWTNLQIMPQNTV